MLRTLFIWVCVCVCDSTRLACFPLRSCLACDNAQLDNLVPPDGAPVLRQDESSQLTQDSGSCQTESCVELGVTAAFTTMAEQKKRNAFTLPVRFVSYLNRGIDY